MTRDETRREREVSPARAGWGPHLRVRVLVLAAVLIPLTVGLNYLFLQRPMNSVLTRDQRNVGVVVQVRYGFYVDLSTIVYNVLDVAPGRGCIDVFRPFLQFAYRVKRIPVRQVVLARNGSRRFLLTGADFAEFGREYPNRSPIASIPVMMREVRRLDGSPVFPAPSTPGEPTDDVVARQFSRFCEQWTRPAN